MLVLTALVVEARIFAAAAPEWLKALKEDCPARPLQWPRLTRQTELQAKLTEKLAWKTQLYSASHLLFDYLRARPVPGCDTSLSFNVGVAKPNCVRNF